jgi:hypothetical protein
MPAQDELPVGFGPSGTLSNIRSALVLGSQPRNRLRKVSQPVTYAVIRVYDEAGNVIETHECRAFERARHGQECEKSVG